MNTRQQKAREWIRHARLVTIAVLLGLPAGRQATADSISAAQGVLQRVVGTNRAAGIILETLPQVDGRDVYEYEAANGMLTVRGSSSVAMCRGTYDYLRASRLGTVGWAGPRLDLPAQWPDAPLTPGETPFKIRHCYNVVTAGYTFPFWTWDRWQQELDWLAMHGYNMIMAPVATEAILTRVWEDLGLTQAEIDEYFNGPAHLPWNRMGNIRQVGGTMTTAWHTDQITLQSNILARARELGIEPIVQGFAGFVPPGITRIYPDTTLYTASNWGGFGGSNTTRSILPDDPLFADITDRFITAWSNEFGDAQYYLVDSFNEMSLPPGDPETLLAGYGSNTYNALVAADPDAIWVLQGWMFTYQTGIWNTGTVAALMNAVPDDDRLLVLDYANEYTDFYGLSANSWERFNAFGGKSWVMGYVPNMGGKTAYTGKMDYYARQVAATLQDPGRSNLVGFTVSAEGFDNNEVLFELMSDSAWSSNAINLNQWLPAYAENRYGQASPVVAAAWEQLRNTVYQSFTDHPSFGWQKLSLGYGTVYRGVGFIQAVEAFLSVEKTLGSDPNYQDDAIEMVALALGLRAEEYFVLANSAYNGGNPVAAESYGDDALALLLEADRLLESHSQHRLQRWIDFARNHNGTPAEKDEYERSARQIVTIWGPPINDYSCRMWSGLIRDFYAPRMEAKIDAMLAGQGFNRGPWEAAWVNATGISTVTPYADPAAKARVLFETAYADVLDDLPGLDELVGRWYPNQMSTNWNVLEWDFPADKLDQLVGVTFIYTAGAHRLDISNASIVADGVEVVVDEHPGSTGLTHTDNFYTLDVPDGTPANNSCKLRATVKSDGGTDCSGMVIMKLKSSLTISILAPSSVTYLGTAPEAIGISLDVEDNIINGNGLDGTLLPDGSNIDVVSHDAVSFTPPGNAWVTTDPGGADSDFFSSSPATVVFGFDLGGTSTNIDAFVSWGYHFGAHNGNSVSSVTLDFSTDGGTTTDSSQTIAVPLPWGSHDLASIVTFSPVTANYITMTVNDNHFTGTPGFGGDRVGIAEIRFASGFTTPPIQPIGEVRAGGIVPVAGGQGMILSWSTAAGQFYSVHYKTNLVTQPDWMVYTNVTGTDGDLTITTLVDHAEGYYRIVTP